MDVPIRAPTDALAQPTRARLFSLLGELRRAASTDELAERLGLHPNGVRTHLERLEQAGLIVRERERRGRGRPRNLWSISADARPGGDAPSAYEALSTWLVRSIAEGPAGVPDVEATGRRIGRELATTSGVASGEARMHGLLIALGFQPERRRGGDDRLTYRLRNCPYRHAARERQPVVCGLHRGMTQGLLEEVDPETRLVGFVPKDPYAAGCLIEVRGPLAREVTEDETSAQADARDGR